MGDDSHRFRKRAHECRELVGRAHGAEWQGKLVEMAGELDDAADKIDAEDPSLDRDLRAP